MAAPGRHRHRRADAPGEPVADAERGQGDPAVHRARSYPDYDALTQGAGFLNAEGRGGARAVPRRAGDHRLSVHVGLEPAHHLGQSRRRAAARLTPGANAWATDVTWGAATTPGGQTIVWGVSSAPTMRLAAAATTRHATAERRLGTAVRRRELRPCRGARTTVVGASRRRRGDTVVWGTSEGEGDTVVWGTARLRATRSCGARAAPTRLRARRSGTRDA